MFLVADKQICILKALIWGFLGGAVVKNSPANVRDAGLIPGLRRSPREGNGNPVFLPGKSQDTGAWRAVVHGVAKELDDLAIKQQQNCAFLSTYDEIFKSLKAIPAFLLY